MINASDRKYLCYYNPVLQYNKIIQWFHLYTEHTRMQFWGVIRKGKQEKGQGGR